MPAVSVIIPNYNHASFLRERIDSVLKQTYRDFEVIILDDCSSDNSREIIETYRGHEKITHIEYNTVNSGSTFKQWKKGLDRAKGEWIWIAESDDVANPLFLETVSGYFKSDTAIVFSKSYLIDKYGNVNGELLLKDNIRNTLLFNGIEFIENFMIANNAIANASAVIFNKCVYDNTTNKIEKLKLSGDYNLWLVLASKGNVQYVDKFLNYFRNHYQNVRSKHNSFEIYINESRTNLSVLLKILPDSEKHIMDKWIYQVFKGINNKRISIKDWLKLLVILLKYNSFVYFIKCYLKR